MAGNQTVMVAARDIYADRKPDYWWLTDVSADRTAGQ
jgi:hypothetical protein